MSTERTRLIRVVPALALLLLTRAALAANTGSVQGKVVDAAHRPNESVKVTLTRGDKELASAYTDTDGKFTLPDVPAGKGYTLLAVRKVRVTTMSGKKEDVAVKAGETTDVGEIQLQLGNAN